MWLFTELWLLKGWFPLYVQVNYSSFSLFNDVCWSFLGAIWLSFWPSFLLGQENTIMVDITAIKGNLDYSLVVNKTHLYYLKAFQQNIIELEFKREKYYKIYHYYSAWVEIDSKITVFYLEECLKWLANHPDLSVQDLENYRYELINILEKKIFSYYNIFFFGSLEDAFRQGNSVYYCVDMYDCAHMIELKGKLISELQEKESQDVLIKTLTHHERESLEYIKLWRILYNDFNMYGKSTSNF